MSNTTRRFLMAAAGGKKSTYVNDVFHTEVFVSPNQNADYKVTNNIDNAGEGGFLWYKQRNGTSWNLNWDTVRGSNKYIYTNSNSAESTGELLKSFDSDGYTIKTGTTLVDPARENVLWNFRRAPGFFDIVTWSGNSTGGRQIAHNLGSVPGCIMIKNTNNTQTWQVYHRGISAGSAVFLDLMNAKQTGAQFFNNTEPTATHFTLGTDCMNNCTGYDYIAYVFAGGKGTNDKAVEFDGTDDYLTVASSSDLTMGTGDFTIECWLNKDAQTHKGVWQISGSSTGLETNNYGDTIALGYQSGVWQIYGGGGYQNSASYPIVANQWYHAAYVRSSGTSKLYIDGVEVISRSDTTNYAGTTMVIGGYYSINYLHNGRISNLRVVKGQALYTSNFTVPHDPYTTTSQNASATNVKLLCCNGSTTTASTVTPSTISATNNPSVTTNNSIFDDAEANVFGEEGDQNLIKTGSYLGNGSTTAREINLGWEPQWILVKCAENTEAWVLFDSMRGIVSGGNDFFVEPNDSGAENTFQNWIELTPTGFKIITGNHQVNQNNKTYIYTCIRRPDGYVGKPAEAGTDAFNVVYGNSSSTIPNFPSNFPVDMGIYKQPATAYSWYLHTRLVGPYNLKTDSTSAQAPAAPGDGDATFDSNAGWGKFGYNTDKASWMWKRGAGFDVITYDGVSATRTIQHSMGKVPEMMWFKSRTSSDNWQVYHKGLNGGTNPASYTVRLNASVAESNIGPTGMYSNLTSNNITLHSNGSVNFNSKSFVAMLFASVDGISSVGSYSPTSSSTTVTCGFQPRFVVVKAATKDNTWSVADSLRGMTAGNDPALALNENWENDKYGGADWIDVSATGFTVNSTGSGTADANSNGETYIYYAHA